MSEAPPASLPIRWPRVHAFFTRAGNFLIRQWNKIAHFFTTREPTFLRALPILGALVFVLYSRPPGTNYIFDEQEALLANPYVNQVGFRYQDAIYRDFWGLPPNASIGSYRPIPNYLWRGLVELGERLQPTHDKVAPVVIEALPQFLEEQVPPERPPLTHVARQSFLQQWYNLVLHAIAGALFVAIGWRLTKSRLAAWLAGLTFVTSAILTEAVSGCVGIADILGGLGALMALAALGLRAYAMPFGVFLAILFGLFSKESAIVCIPLVPVAALLISPIIHPERPARIARGALAFVGCLAAFVLYVELRKRWFPSPLPAEHAVPVEEGASLMKQLVHDFFVWFHQAPLPRDPLNNPLVDAPVDLRFGGALRVYFRGLTQVVFPLTLSGDYSFPQEPAPETMIFPESILGWLATVLPLGAALGLWIVSMRRERRERTPLPERTARSWKLLAVEPTVIVIAILLTAFMLSLGPSKINEGLGDSDPSRIITIDPRKLTDGLIYAALGCLAAGALVEALWKRRTEGYLSWHLPTAAVGLVWLVVSYFPHSNIPVLLPTVRAERLWYFPVLGTTMVIAALLTGAVRACVRRNMALVGALVPIVFLGFQASRAYGHAMDYRDDLQFWAATKEAVPNSAKAHLNYSVMAGARGQMATRLFHSEISKQLAPKWAMAHVYTGDTLCRMDRVDEAWPHYEKGFALGPNDKGLIALALQCLWDEKRLKEHELELRALCDEHPGSWLAYLADDTLRNGDTQGGVHADHRPRSYNEGPKKKETAADSDATGSDAGETADPSASAAASDPSADPAGSVSGSGAVSGALDDVGIPDP